MWYAQSGSRYKDNGKFRSYSQSGIARQTGEQYRDWSYGFVSHQTGVSVKRTSYHVSIIDPFGNRVEYLRGFSSIDRARTAAREWIDELMSKLKKPAAINRGLGSIPPVPSN